MILDDLWFYGVQVSSWGCWEWSQGGQPPIWPYGNKENGGHKMLVFVFRSEAEGLEGPCESACVRSVISGID